jgi:RHS repeat-associated protein
LPNQIDACDGRNTVRYGYDGAGSRVARKDTSASGSYLTTYAYGDAELPTSMASQAAGWSGGSPAATTWSYDAAGRQTFELAPTGLRSTSAWAPDDTLTSVIRTNNANPPSSANTVAAWSYVYDGDYRQSSQTFNGLNNAGTPLAAKSLYYSYDAAGRVSAVGRDALSTLFATWDHDGNRTAYNDPAPVTVTQTYRADDSIATRTEGATAHTYKQYAWGGLELADVGNVDKRTVYDGFDRTACVGATTLPNDCSGADVTYAYDGLDRQRAVGAGTALHYDGLGSAIAVEEALAPVTDTAMALDPAAMPVGETTFAGSAIPRYLDDDGHGNVATVTWAAGIDCTARYDPFGTPVTNAGQGSSNCYSGSTANDFFYRSGRRDSAGAAYQFGSRTYDAKKAAFTTPDSYRAAAPAKDLSIGTDPLTANRYNYVNGDPVNLSDPDGHICSGDSPQSWRECQHTRSYCMEQRCTSNSGKTFISQRQYDRKHVLTQAERDEEKQINAYLRPFDLKFVESSDFFSLSQAQREKLLGQALDQASHHFSRAAVQFGQQVLGPLVIIAAGGVFASRSAAAVVEEEVGAVVDPAASRVTLREGTRAEIQANAPQTASGDFIDPNTGQVIPKDGPFDYGHRPGYEWWRTQQMAREGGWTREQVIEYENDPSHYQIEDPSANQSHRYEME